LNSYYISPSKHLFLYYDENHFPVPQIHSSAVISLLKSEIKTALKSAFGNLDGPLCVTDWCKGRFQSGDGATTCDGLIGESTLSGCKDSSSIVTLPVGEPMSPALSCAAGSSSLKGMVMLCSRAHPMACLVFEFTGT
jgi:hypothetical protein